MTGGIASGLGALVCPAALVEGASEVVEGDALWLPLEHAAISNTVAMPKARCLRLIASRELSHMRDGYAMGGCHKLARAYVKLGRETRSLTWRDALYGLRTAAGPPEGVDS